MFSLLPMCFPELLIAHMFVYALVADQIERFQS